MLYIIILITSLIFQYLSRIILNKNTSSLFDFLSIITMFIFSGLRFDVGKDYWVYFTGMASPDYEVEIGSRLVIDIILKINLSMQCFIFFLAFFSGVFIYYSVKYFDKSKKSRYLFIILIFFLILFDSMNISRQFLSISIIAFSVKFIYQKKLIIYIFWVIIASSFHYTAIIFLVIYPFLNLVNRFSRKLLLYNALILISVLNMILPIISSINQKLFGFIIRYFPKYSVYSERLLSDDYYFSEMFFVYSILLLLIINSNKKLLYLKDKTAIILMPLSVLFIVAFSIFNFSDLTLRFYLYFLFFFIGLLSCLNRSRVRRNKQKNMTTVLIYIFTFAVCFISVKSYLTISELKLYPYKTILNRNISYDEIKGY